MANREPQLLVIGLGGGGSWVLELLARTEGVSYVVSADHREEWGRRKLYNLAAGAMLQGHCPRLEFTPIDLQNIEATAETIARLQPRLTFNCAMLQSWWLRKKLSPEIDDRLSEAGSGPWLPNHLTLVVNETDYYRLGRNLENLGLAGLTLQQFDAYLKTGWKPY